MRVACSFDILFQLMTEGNVLRRPIKTTLGVPKDAVYVGSAYDPMRNEVDFVFSHPSFEPIPPAYEIPLSPVQFKEYFDPQADEIYREILDKDV